MTISLLATNGGLVLCMMTILWLVSVKLRDVSIVDPWWSMIYLVISIHTFWHTGASPSKILLLSMVTIWAVRLWLHLLIRSRGKPEDPRYQAFRKRFGPERYWWFSFGQVFLLQGSLALLISAPLQIALGAEAPQNPGLTDMVGAGIFALGFGIEAVADWQLVRFRASPQRGPILDTGLWAWSRHPNYFGDALLWWGLWLCAIDTPYGWATTLSPMLMTFLLVRVSGVRMLDAHLRETRPEYAAYMDRTSGFVPWPPSNQKK